MSCQYDKLVFKEAVVNYKDFQNLIHQLIIVYKV